MWSPQLININNIWLLSVVSIKYSCFEFLNYFSNYQKDTYIWSLVYRVFRLTAIPFSSISLMTIISGTPSSGDAPVDKEKRPQIRLHWCIYCMYSELKDTVCREHHSNHRNSTRFDKIKSSVIDLCRLLILFRLQ